MIYDCKWFNKGQYHSHEYISTRWMLPSIITWVSKSLIVKEWVVNKHMYMNVHVVTPDFYLRTPWVTQEWYDGLVFEVEISTCDKPCFCINNFKCLMPTMQWNYRDQVITISLIINQLIIMMIFTMIKLILL